MDTKEISGEQGANQGLRRSEAEGVFVKDTESATSASTGTGSSGESDWLVSVDNSNKTTAIDLPETVDPGVPDCQEDKATRTDDAVCSDSDSANLNTSPLNISGFTDIMTASVIEKATTWEAKNKEKVGELLQHQGVLLESLQHENEKFSSSDCFSRMSDTIEKCKVYHNKLLNMKKFMNDITYRTAKLKKQCIKLQQMKTKYDVEEEEARRKEMERERQLVAQPVKPSTT